MAAGPCTHYRVQVESAHLFGPLSLVPCSQLWVVGPAWSYKDTRTDLQNCGGPTRLRGTNGAKKTISVRRTLDIMESQNSRAGPVAQKEGQGPPAKLSLTLDQPPCATRDPTIHHYISFAALGETPSTAGDPGIHPLLFGDNPLWEDRSFGVHLRVECAPDDGAKWRWLASLLYGGGCSADDSEDSKPSGTDNLDNGLSGVRAFAPVPLSPLTGAAAMAIPVGSGESVLFR